MKSWLRDPLFVFGLVLAWRVGLLIFTAQPIPANDAFGYDGAVVNYLHGGGYFNPSFSVIFPISGRQVYATYPPVYQGVLLAWMKLFGTSAISAMVLHLVLFAISGFLTMAIIKKYFPAAAGWALVALLYFGFTFDDRPDGLAFVFGLASLWLVMQQISSDGFHPGAAAALAALLVLGLYTSVIAGAYFFGVGFLTSATAFLWRRKFYWFGPFLVAAALFAILTLSIVKLEPLWWAGFMESVRQQSVSTTGFHLPGARDLLKLIRTAPVFLVALGLTPLVLARGKEMWSDRPVWLGMLAGIFVMSWALLVASMTFLSPTYVSYALPTQVILAAGILIVSERYYPNRICWTRGFLIGCVLLVSIRAVGMSTWGVVCAWKNSYASTQKVLESEFKPFVTSDRPVLISSPFLYCAVGMRVKNPIHCDWYFDHAEWTNNAQLDAMIRLRPAKLALSQIDYHRSFMPVLEQLRQHPDQVAIQVRDFAAIPVPDGIPSMRLVVQHISWAPVIVDLDWKNPVPN